MESLLFTFETFRKTPIPHAFLWTVQNIFSHNRIPTEAAKFIERAVDVSWTCHNAMFNSWRELRTLCGKKNISTIVNPLEVDRLAECQEVSVNKSPRVRGSVLRNLDYTWNPESTFHQSRTQSLQAFWSAADQRAWLWVRDWCSTNKESGNSVPGIRNRWRGIQNLRLCCIPLHGAK